MSVKNEFETIDWIKKVVDSCQTFAQWQNACKMVLRYSIHRPNNPGVILAITALQEYTLAKGRTLTNN